MPWECPNITIGGLPIPEQKFHWGLSAGPTPYITEFWTAASEYPKFLALKNPIEIIIQVTGGTNGEPEPKTIKIENAWLLAPARISDRECIWRIADSRYTWQGRMLTFSYNKTRIKNDVTSVLPPTEMTPAKLREPYDTFSQGRYILRTVKKSGKPYSIGEIIATEFDKLGIPFYNANNQDLSFMIENVECVGESMPKAIAYLCQLGRLNIGITLEGKVYAYSIFSYEYQNENMLTYIEALYKTSPGTIYKQDKRKIRPFAIDIHFEKEIETWFSVGEVATTILANDYKNKKVVGISPIADVWTAQDISDRRVIGLINVIQAPLPVTIDGVEINIGEWVPMHKFLTAYGLTDQFVREKYFSGIMETDLSRQLKTSLGIAYDQAQRIAYHVCSAIKESYRQIFMIEPYWMDRIKSWRPRRVAVINNFDRYSQVSPLFADYCTIPYLRNPFQAKGVASWGHEPQNWVVDDEDPKRENPFTAGTVEVVNQPLGILKISYPKPMDQTTCMVLPFAVDNLPLPSVGGAQPYLSKCKIKSSYSLATIMSVIWDVDKDDNFAPNGAAYSNDSKYWTVPVGLGTEGEREFHPFEYISDIERARFAIKKDKYLPGSVSLPVNYAFLQALAHSEAARIIIGFKDFYAGVIVGAGYVPVKPVGNINIVLISFSPQKGLETIIDMCDSLPQPMIEHNLQQEHIDYLRKHVSRVDNAAETVGGA